jgi:hypothetical protein
MTMDPRQFILLLIAIAVPLYLSATNRRRLLVGWVCVTLFVHVFDTVTITNLPAGRIVGLLYLPTAVLNAPAWLKLRPARAWLLNFGYLVILGVIFGFLWPWADITGNRPITMQAPGRAVIYLVRMLADVSLTVFLTRELLKPGAILYAARMMLLGALLTATAGIVFLVKPEWDFYLLITGLRDYIFSSGIDRARGLSFEPRGLGMACAYGVMILILLPGAIWRRALQLVALLLGLLASYSASALALLGTGVATSWLFFSGRVRRAVIGMLLLLVAFIAVAAIVIPDKFAVAADNIQQRFDPTMKLQGAVAENLGQEIAYRLDAFDASATLFLLDQPQFLLLGSGPGMVLLPASAYVPPGVYSILYGPDVGLNGLPTLGLLHEVSNSGIVGLIAWLVQVIAGWKALRYLGRHHATDARAREWRFGLALFLLGAAFYVVQMSPTSPVWSVILAIGWAAVAEAAALRARARAPAAVPAAEPLPEPEPVRA